MEPITRETKRIEKSDLQASSKEKEASSSGAAEAHS